MPGGYEIERSEPSLSRCDCCGGLSVRLTRFVHRDGDAFAIYYAAYANGHGDELSVLVSLGDWGEDGDPSRRAAFSCRVRPTDDAYEVMLADAAESPWGHADVVGEKLSRGEARAHPWKTTAFEVLDQAFAQDPSLRGFLQRVQCGDAAVPLEPSHAWPDDIFELDEDERRERADTSRNFAALDRARFFVRCLLPVPVEHYGTWCVGLWVEVAEPDYDQVRGAWDDPERYPRVRFTGVLANDIAPLALPIALGSRVHVHVPDPEAPPMIEATASGDLARTWSRVAFEEYAVARGFL